MNNAVLQVGVATARITAPVGSPMSGFAGRGPSTDVHDDLRATALVLQGEHSADEDPAIHSVVLICCDLLSLGDPQIHMFKAAISEGTSIPSDNILIASSHNHYGPVTDHTGTAIVSESGPQTLPYVENLAFVLDGLVRQAMRRLTAGRLAYGSDEAHIAINRRESTPDGVVLGRNPDGPMNPRVAVLRVDKADGSPVAVIANYACHGVSLGSSCTEYTADFPGVMRNVVKTATGAECLFMQGAAGDVNPAVMGDDWLNPEQLGTELASSVIRAYRDAAPLQSPVQVAATETILDLPGLLPSSEHEALLAVEDLRAQLKDAEATGNRAQQQWSRSRIDRLETGIQVLRGVLPRPTVRAPVTAVRIGAEVGIVTAPGEVFTQIGSEIVSHSPFPLTFYSGYTNGSINYIPTRAAYAEGGYEVSHACQVAPEAGEILAKESIAALRSAYHPMLRTRIASTGSNKAPTHRADSIRAATHGCGRDSSDIS